MDIPYLKNPSFIELDDAFRGLPKLGEIKISHDAGNISDLLTDLENIGYVGIEVSRNIQVGHGSRIRAFKGKHGPCYDAGHTVRYLGGALAVLDDDNHLFFNSKIHSVCEKTAGILQLPVYQGMILCDQIIDSNTRTDKSISKKKFSKNEYEEDLERLYQKLQSTKKRSGPWMKLYYPGPFRYLILDDGTIVSRGKVNDIPEEVSKLLIKKDGLVRAEKEEHAELQYFQDLYIDQGSNCFLGKIIYQQKNENDYETDLNALYKIEKGLKSKLVDLINNNKKYFLLVGSDPGDQFGCCPSDMVGEANELIKAGILSGYSQSDMGENCPLSTYAFKGEINFENQDLKFLPNNSFRQKILSKIEQKSNRTFFTFIKWILIGFVLVSLVIAFNRLIESQDSEDSKLLYEYLSPAEAGQVFVVLFHNEKRCHQCLNMETFTETALDGYFHKEYNMQEIKFKLIIMDKPENQDIVDDLGLITASLVLVSYDVNGNNRTTVVEQAWSLYNNKNEFMKMLEKEIKQFMKEGYD